MSGQMITDARVLALIEAYGADPDMFPEAERAAAKARMADNPARFATALSEAQALDGLFADIPHVSPSPALRETLIASAPKPRSARSSRWKLPVWIPAGALASLTVGLFAGMSVAQPVTTQDEQAEAAVYAALGFDTYTLELEEEVMQ
ncbi:MAG TPA: hypothetical protein DCG65_05855 [Hyphomonas atlantica]|uniref:Anti-sigma factor n=1 Tax=Hyphomonas atlantica TaxID=1280948 RepID=A0A3B9L0L2_9PROT|nr:hypothetical protein [Hyphomonas atlantica]